ncbi:MAG: hypothetical protein NZ529_10875 [Cytophagaceae bacterium]|nr:hypothetical protein [Cytophagaceae bacterium]MDW8457288.1 hypothetical protein [Cytophagaceae bacterium]
MENEIREVIGLKSLHTKAHTFATHASPSKDRSLQKSVLFASLKRNSFFIPSLAVLFFRRVQATQKQLDRNSEHLYSVQPDNDGGKKACLQQRVASIVGYLQN